MEISVIIVNYNVRFFLEQCLSSLLIALEGVSSEIIVIDNNSTDGSREYLEPKFPIVQFHWETTNHGFSKANNIALKFAKGDHILFLNPDTILPEQAVTSCLKRLKADKTFGALGVKMISGNGSYLPESKRGFPTPAVSMYRMLGLTKIFPRSKRFASYYQGHLDKNKTAEVDVLAGAFMMMTPKAIQTVNGFDEDFFMYGEDIDLSYRVKKSGLKNIYFPEVTIIHFKGESTQKNSASYNTHFYGAMKLFIRKHYRLSGFKFMMLDIAISLKKALSNKKGSSSPGTKYKGGNTAVIANQQDFDNLIQLLKFSDPSLTIVRRIEPAKDILLQVSKEEGLKNIVFSGNSMTNKEIIINLEKLPRKFHYYFHCKNTGSIVGSPDKNQPGHAIFRDRAY